ncbi:MAG TPA: hypothetical protein VNL38_02510 [Candidatus Nitrosotenuis sp.]|nr:hypothetical protein [Candidatus Nitrosotenuis sp.]
MAESISAETTLARLRGFLLALLLFEMLATGAELVLVEHYEDPWQWAPLALLACGLMVLGWQAIAPGKASVRATQGLMMLFLLSGVAGTALHWKGKMEFKKESSPSLSGFQLWRESLHTQTPPALAPGVMTQMGLLGLLCVYRHPALGKNQNDSSSLQGE